MNRRSFLASILCLILAAPLAGFVRKPRSKLQDAAENLHFHLLDKLSLSGSPTEQNADSCTFCGNPHLTWSMWKKECGECEAVWPINRDKQGLPKFPGQVFEMCDPELDRLILAG